MSYGYLKPMSKSIIVCYNLDCLPRVRRPCKDVIFNKKWVELPLHQVRGGKRVCVCPFFCIKCYRFFPPKMLLQSRFLLQMFHSPYMNLRHSRLIPARPSVPWRAQGDGGAALCSGPSHLCPPAPFSLFKTCSPVA